MFRLNYQLSIIWRKIMHLGNATHAIERTPNLRLGVSPDSLEDNFFFKDLPPTTKAKIEENIKQLKTERLINLADLKPLGVQRLEALFGGELDDARRLISYLSIEQLKDISPTNISVLLRRADSFVDLFEKEVLSNKKIIDQDKEQVYMNNPIVRQALAQVDDKKQFESFFIQKTLLSVLIKLDADRLDFFLTAAGRRILSKFGNNSIILNEIDLDALLLLAKGNQDLKIEELKGEILTEVLNKLIGYDAEDIQKYTRGICFLGYSEKIAILFLNDQFTLAEAQLINDKVIGAYGFKIDKLEIIYNILNFYKNKPDGNSSKFDALKLLKGTEVREIFRDPLTIEKKLEQIEEKLEQQKEIKAKELEEKKQETVVTNNADQPKKNPEEVQEVLQQQKSSCCIIV